MNESSCALVITLNGRLDDVSPFASAMVAIYERDRTRCEFMEIPFMDTTPDEVERQWREWSVKENIIVEVWFW